MPKALTLEQSLTQILSAPQAKAKLKFPDVWIKIQPFLLMLGTFFPKLEKPINSLIAAINAYLAGSKAVNPKIVALWAKIKPFVTLLKMFGKKVSAYVDALIAFMDTFTATDDEGEE